MRLKPYHREHSGGFLVGRSSPGFHREDTKIIYVNYPVHSVTAPQLAPLCHPVLMLFLDLWFFFYLSPCTFSVKKWVKPTTS